MTVQIVGEMIQERRVDNPLTTWSQFLHELDAGNPLAGANKVPVNLRTLMGGFCKFHGNEAQNKAAARYKSLHEQSQLGGSKAVDPSLEPVDGGGNNPEAIFEIGIDARKLFREANDYLGRVPAAQFHFVVVMERGPTAYARHFLGAGDGRTVSRGEVDVRRIADHLAVLWKYQSAPA